MYWTIYESILNLYQGFLFTWFITKILPKKKKEYLSSLICSLLTAGALSTYLFLTMPEWDTWVFLFIIFYTMVFFDGEILQKVFWDTILVIISLGTIGISYQFFSILSGSDTNAFLTSGSTRILFTLTANFLIWLGLWLITRIFHKDAISTPPPYLLLTTVILCAFLIEVFFKFRNQYGIPLWGLFTGCGIVVAITIVTILNYRILEQYSCDKQTIMLQKEMLKEARSQSEDMQHVYGTMLQLRHDVRSFVHDVQEMVNNGQISRKTDFLDEIESRVLPLYSSGNQMLDSVLTVKLNKLQSNKIELKGTNLHYTSGMNISDFALCSLVSNMLDNAIEALNDRKDCEGDRYVYLQFAYSPAGLAIICENPLMGILPKMHRTSFLSKKYEPYHGLGISIMKRLVDEADGTFETVVSDDLFRVLAIIPPKDNDSFLNRKDDSHDNHSKNN